MNAEQFFELLMYGCGDEAERWFGPITINPEKDQLRLPTDGGELVFNLFDNGSGSFFFDTAESK